MERLYEDLDMETYNMIMSGFTTDEIKEYTKKAQKKVWLTLPRIAVGMNIVLIVGLGALVYLLI